jgi:F-type H+-transporting ATPase subunit b
MTNTAHILVLGLQSSLATGLSLNTNVLDTNLINLAIVIGILVYFGRQILQDTLNSRKEKIVTQIEDAKKQYEEVKQTLLEAKELLSQAKVKEIEIRANGEVDKKRQIQLLIEAHKEALKRLQNVKDITVQLEQQKAVQDLRNYVITSAFKQAEEFLKDHITPDLHVRINDYQLGILKLVKPVK